MRFNVLGVYIGRYLRYNSWDIVANPLDLLTDIFGMILHPLRHHYAWDMIFCYSVLLTLIYLALNKITNSSWGNLYFIAFLAVVVIVLVCWDFLYYLMHRERYFVRFRHVLEIIVLFFPLAVLKFDIGTPNDCCGDSALFSPDHRLTVIVLVLLCLGAYFYSSTEKKWHRSLLRSWSTAFLLTGILLNITVGIQIKEIPDWIFGHLPIMMLFILAMGENHKKAMESLEQQGDGDSRLIAMCRKIVHLSAWKKVPVLLLLCLPLLVILVGILLLFGQKPDSLVRAFTDTYKHGFSQLDYQCEGVVCGGHFLCTVAARGHPGLVKPVRSGFRAGKLIKCNRQLLVSNAFEELLEQRLPGIHRPVRALYNRIGSLIHRYYGVFNNVWVSDLIYLLMKPLEGLFLLVLYLCDRNPENRIARQYLRRADRQELQRADSKKITPPASCSPDSPLPREWYAN